MSRAKELLGVITEVVVVTNEERSDPSKFGFSKDKLSDMGGFAKNVKTALNMFGSSSGVDDVWTRETKDHLEILVPGVSLQELKTNYLQSFTFSELAKLMEFGEMILDSVHTLVSIKK